MVNLQFFFFFFEEMGQHNATEEHNLSGLGPSYTFLRYLGVSLWHVALKADIN